MNNSNLIKPNTLLNVYNNSIKEFSNRTIFSTIGGEEITYCNLSVRVNSVIELLNRLSINAQEHIAILGGSSPNWPISYLATTITNRVALPLLPDFSAFEIGNIINHSQTKNLFVSKKLYYKISNELKESLDNIISLDDFSILKSNREENKGNVIIENQIPTPESIASIIYTSGTSGASKGVVLTHRNISANIEQATHIYPINKDDIFLSFLPLSHAYECSMGMLYPFSIGAQVKYLNGAPTPSVLIPALAEVKPTCVCSVPLIVEKIYRSKIRPTLTKNGFMKFIYSIAPCRKMLHKIAGKKVMALFGGRIRFFGIGGSKIDPLVEQFLKDAHFPYAIGYGLTECSPLIAGQIGNTVLQSAGTVLYGVEMKINNPNNEGIGEILVKGPNVMQGYYKDAEKTKAAFTEDGWFRTRDLGVFNKDGYLFIKGRVDNMIIGSNGENIYPEDIERVLNENKYVLESLVNTIGERLVARVHFNKELIDAEGGDIEQIKSELLRFTNEKVNKTSKLSEIIEQPTPFEKTATQKIRRFLYS